MADVSGGRPTWPEPGRIWHERRREDGTLERIPGWLSYRDEGNIVLDVLTPEEARWAGFPEDLSDV